MFVSLTRLHLRHFWTLVQFTPKNEAAIRQVLASPGFVTGRLLVADPKTFWTITGWADEKSMKAYRGSGAHREVMALLPEWCDEASVMHWTQESSELPTWEAAHVRMQKDGRLSPVNRPSKRHQERKIPKPLWNLGRPLTPSSVA